MKFYQKRGFALVVLILAIIGSGVYGISKKPAAPPEVSYYNWICDEAGLLDQETRQTIQDYNTAWNKQYYAVVAVAAVDDIRGWSSEDYARELGARWGLGANDMLLLLVKGGDWYVACGDNLADLMTDTQQTKLKTALDTPYYSGNYAEAAVAFFRQSDVVLAQTLAHGVLVHEADAAHIGDHPPVIERHVQGRDQVLGEGAQQHAPRPQPLLEVIGGVGHAAPLAAHGDHVALAVQGAQVLFTGFQQVQPFGGGHGGDGLGLADHPADIVLDVGLLLDGEGLPVGLLQHIPDDAAHFLQVPALCLPVHVVLGPEELGVGEFHLCHYLVPPFFWMRLISRDSTKAWTRVRSWPELPLLYRRSMDSTGQLYSSCMI